MNQDEKRTTVLVDLGVTLDRLGEIEETARELAAAAPKAFEDEPFLAAHMKRASVMLLELHYRASRAYSDQLHAVDEVSVSATSPTGGKPRRVKHVFEADGICRQMHEAGVVCGEARKRKPRGAGDVAKPAGEGSES